jgi:uncharacterized membrane protein
MTGYLLAILTCIFFGLQGAYGKVLGRYFTSAIITWATFTFSLPFVMAFLFINGLPHIDFDNFVWSTLASFLINVVAFNLFFKALSVSSLSLTMPFTAFTPLFLIPISFFMLGELPDIKGISGIMLIIFGAYGIHSGLGNLIAPFRNLFLNRGTRYMMIVAVMWSITATLEKVAILSSSPEFYAVTINSLLSAAHLPYIYFFHRKAAKEIPKNLGKLALIGIISGAMALSQFTALQYLFVSYVIAFKRAGAFVSVVLGFILFREKNILRNLIFTSLIVAGAILIMLAG